VTPLSAFNLAATAFLAVLTALNYRRTTTLTRLLRLVTARANTAEASAKALLEAVQHEANQLMEAREQAEGYRDAAVDEGVCMACESVLPWEPPELESILDPALNEEMDGADASTIRNERDKLLGRQSDKENTMPEPGPAVGTIYCETCGVVVDEDETVELPCCHKVVCADCEADGMCRCDPEEGDDEA
jgi:hypothetical protein